jgi:la-related protein 1
MLWSICLPTCELCSDDNLCKDTYLRQRMDDQGWVPLSLIAGFPKVSFQVLWVDFSVKSTLNS